MSKWRPKVIDELLNKRCGKCYDEHWLFRDNADRSICEKCQMRADILAGADAMYEGMLGEMDGLVFKYVYKCCGEEAANRLYGTPCFSQFIREKEVR